MKSLMITSVLFLTACASSTPPVIIPDALTREVTVVCQQGDTSRHFGRCAIALRQGLDSANSQLRAIREIVAQ